MTQADTTTTQAPHGDHAGDHGHDHPPYLAHHFDSVAQQTDAGKLAMWVFLATEILMFGGLFCAYAVWRSNHYESFWIGHTYLNTWWGALNTLILIASSFTMAWGVRAAQMNNPKLCWTLLLLTVIGGFGFMCIKYVEYREKYDHGLFPGRLYNPVIHAPEAGHAADAPKAAGATTLFEIASGFKGRDHGSQNHTAEEMRIARPFFSIYFLLTGLHGIHVLIGMTLIIWVMIRVARGEFSSRFNAPVDIVGLYWHLVDLIWIFLFPLLYLI